MPQLASMASDAWKLLSEEKVHAKTFLPSDKRRARARPAWPVRQAHV
jgi:hypothetical protein